MADSAAQQIRDAMAGAFTATASWIEWIDIAFGTKEVKR